MWGVRIAIGVVSAVDRYNSRRFHGPRRHETVQFVLSRYCTVVRTRTVHVVTDVAIAEMQVNLYPRGRYRVQKRYMYMLHVVF